MKMSLKTSLRLKQRRKAGDPWVSTNRVLNGLSKKPGNFGRNPNFDTDETKLLIQLWGDPKVQRALITTHKKHAVISQLAQKMRGYGYYRSPEEITTRIKNLKCFYNRIKKDIETGQELSSKPSWKHFDEMDAIMTRPIFSVRPDEVPAPSLKFRLEQAREELAERRKRMQNDDNLNTDAAAEDSNDFMNDDSLDADDRQQTLEANLIPDVELDIDINETFVAIAAQEEQSTTESSATKRRKLNQDNLNDNATDEELNKSANIKDEDNVSANSNADADKTDKQETEQHEENDSKSNDGKSKQDNMNAELLEPKQEPIDVDAEDSMDPIIEQEQQNSMQQKQIITNVQQLMPTLADILQMNKDKNLNVATNATNAKVLIPVSSSIATTTTTNATVNNNQSMSGKISLVPTNFLMQPSKNVATRVVNASTAAAVMTQPPQIQFLQSASQQRIVFSSTAAAQGCASNKSAGIMTTGPGGMKVLLLSAEQAAAATAGNSSTVLPKTLGTFLQLQPQLQQQTHSLQLQQQVQQQQQQPKQQQITTQPANIQIQAQLSPTAAAISPQSVKKIDEKILPNTKTQAKKKQQQQQQQKEEPQPLLQQKEQRQHKSKEQQEYQQQQRQQQQQQQQEAPITKKDATNMRILLRQLLNAQFESNAINSRRWKLERDRLEFEKSVAERFFTALPNFMDTLKETFLAQQPQKPAAASPAQQQTTQQPQQAHTTQLYQTAPFLTVSSGTNLSNAQFRLQPPKLLFTAVRHPTLVTSQNTLSLNSPALTPIIPKVTANTEAALLVPKEEPQDN